MLSLCFSWQGWYPVLISSGVVIQPQLIIEQVIVKCACKCALFLGKVEMSEMSRMWT